MISPLRILAGLLVGAALQSAAFAHEPYRISAEISFDGAPDNEAQGEQADAFYATLDAHAGRIVFLDLTVRPNADESGSPGYAIDRLPAHGAASPTPIVCGEQMGMLDNVTSPFSVGMGHPVHFHALMQVVVGDRLSFPHQEITCSSEGITEGPRTPLLIRGYFSVQAADIPTAVEYRLTPANP